MDPDANLAEQRQLAATLLANADADPAAIVPQEALDLAERVQALDAWLMSGGFAPEAWLDKRPAPGKGGLTGFPNDGQQVRLALQRMGFPTDGQHTIQLPIATAAALAGLAALAQQLTTGEV